MTASVSEIKYWKEGSTYGESDSNPNGEAVYLSYDIFMGLSVLGGFLALDHLYLRSPGTFLAKLFVNLMCFGVWWLYDACQAVFNADVVKIYGLGVPGLGPKGIASGVLAKTPDSKHLRFFIYAVCVVYGGLFGMDSFITGDNESGIIRLICMISMVFAPVAIIWWVYKLFQFFVNTRSVTEENWEFFGAPASNVSRKFFSFFDYLAVGPFKKTMESFAQTSQNLSETMWGTVNFATETVKSVGKITDVIKEVATELGPAMKATPMGQVAMMPTVAKIKDAVAKQSGGGSMVPLSDSSDTLTYVLIGTVVSILIAGCVMTYRRISNPNYSEGYAKEKNDVPPEPSNSLQNRKRT
jgi:hypothetical protein